MGLMLSQLKFMSYSIMAHPALSSFKIWLQISQSFSTDKDLIPRYITNVYIIQMEIGLTLAVG